MQLGVGNFVNNSRYRLDLTHALTNGYALIVKREKTIGAIVNRSDINRHRRRSAQGFHEYLIILNVTGQIRCKLGQRFTVCLAHIENLNRLEHGDFNGFLFDDNLAIRIQHRCFGIRIELFLLNLLFVRSGGNDCDTMLTPLHMALKLVTPFIETGNQRCIRTLHINQHGIVHRITVETGHRRQVLAILVAFKQFLYAFFDTLGYLFQSLFVGLLLLCHEFHTPFNSNKNSPGQTGKI